MTGIRLVCIACGASHGAERPIYRCPCGGTLDVVSDWSAVTVPSRGELDARASSRHPLDRSGVWRFRELLPPVPPEAIVTRGEGRTNLYDVPRLAAWCGVGRLRLKHEGENPTGSFKDRGMTVATSVARALGMTAVACASTGNTSASMASYAALAGMAAYVFIPEGNVAYGKLAQALAYGATTLQIEGDFDDAMRLVQEVCAAEGIYLMNSVNPFRIEGQKAIGFELLQDLGWTVPDWIVMPGGNLGNGAAIGKAMGELVELGLAPRRPRLAIVQAAGANPLAQAFREGREDLRPLEAKTLATAIKIGNPVSWRRSLREIQRSGGVVEDVTDQEIMDAKAEVDASGVGAEPASCATVAGLRKLEARGVIGRDEDVCGILTGHLLKDPDTTLAYHRGELAGIDARGANAPVRVAADVRAISRVLARPGRG